MASFKPSLTLVMRTWRDSPPAKLPALTKDGKVIVGFGTSDFSFNSVENRAKWMAKECGSPDKWWTTVFIPGHHPLYYKTPNRLTTLKRVLHASGQFNLAVSRSVIDIAEVSKIQKEWMELLESIPNH